jgi:hypothetical protein
MPSDLLSTLSRPIGATPDRLIPNAFVVPKNQASRSENEFFRFSGNRLPDCVVLFLGTDGNAAHPLPVAHNVLVSDRPRSMAARPDPAIVAADPFEDSAPQFELSSFIEHRSVRVCRLDWEKLALRVCRPNSDRL